MPENFLFQQKNELDFQDYLSRFYIEHKIAESSQNKVRFLPFRDYENFVKTDVEFVVFQDRWIAKPDIIKSKIRAIYGISKRVFARKCELRKIDKKTASLFLNENHIYGATVSKHRFGLFFKDELTALATFAAQRQFKFGKSAEMLRFCNAKDTVVVGGLSKLLKAYVREYQPNDIMTYADIDWGGGSAYQKLGFEKRALKKGIRFYCHTGSGLRIPEKHFADYEQINEYVLLQNSGSLKYVLDL